MSNKKSYESVDDRREAEWVSMKRRMETAKSLEPGKWYTLYQYEKDSIKAVALSRKCVAHYARFASFVDGRGNRHSYTYAELAQMIQAPPAGCKIIPEKQAKREAFLGEE